MSLFERLKNKRYDLIEKRKQRDNSYLFDDDKNTSTSRTRIKSAISDLDATQPGETPKIETGTYTYKKTRRRSTPSLRSGFDTVELENPEDKTKQKKLKQETSKRETIAKKTSPQKFTPEIDADTKVDTKQRIRDSKGNVIANPMEPKKTPGSTQISGVKDTDLEKLVKTEPKTRTVKQSEVSKQAQNFTKEINKKNKNRTFFDPEKAKEARKNLIAKRKEYGIDRKGNISNAGVERYARKTKQLSSGSNVPVKLTQADKDLAKTRMTDKYGRRLGRVRNKNMPSLDQIKKDIELRPYKQKLEKQYNINRGQQRTIQKRLRIDKAIARSGESAIKFRDTARTIAKKIPGLTKTITTPAVANKAGRILTPPKTKTALKPIVKKAITLTQKAGPAGAIVAGTGIALLNPSIRKTFKKVATAGLAAAGIKAATSKPKLVKRPPSKIGINLSPKA